MEPHSPPRALRALVVLVVALTLVLPGWAGEPAKAADSGQTLYDAGYQEHTLQRHAEALELYRKILEDPTPEIRGRALQGAARCEHVLGRHEEEGKLLDRILRDDQLPAAIVDWARGEKAKQITEETEVQRQAAAERAAEQARKERKEANQEASRRHTEEARAALGQRRYEAAKDLILQALAFDEENEEAKALLSEIAAKFPALGELLKSMIEFFYTSRADEFQRIRKRVDDSLQEGKAQFARKQYEAADKAFRSAIESIDRSDFLGDLADERVHLVKWLGQTTERAKAQGLLLPPPPPLPKTAPRQTGYQGRFFQVLAEMFTERGERSEPLVIYEAAPGPVASMQPERSLGPATFGGPGGITPSRAPGMLSRARWLERAIRTTIEPGTWPVQGGKGAETASRGGRHVLERVRDFLVVQHTPAVQARVSELLSSFRPDPAPVQVDVAVFAAAEGGTVRASDRLRVRASPQESGLDLVVSGRLIEECVRDLAALEGQGLKSLGTATLVLRGETTATVELTQLTERSPQYAGLKPPALTVPDVLARYGLWLELYAEAMPHAPRNAGLAAVSVRTVARWPSGSVVVPKTTRDADWMRLPEIAEHVLEADRSVPQVGTLMLLGIPNPFSPSRETYPDLVILVGARLASPEGGPAPVPDPPRASPLPGAESDAAIDRSHVLGPLATEVTDDLVLEGWPQRPATVPVPRSVATEDRATFLSQWIATQAGVWKHGSTEENPVTVRDGVAWAHVAPEQQERIAAVVQRIQEQESALYEVDVVAVETTVDRAMAWSRTAGVSGLGAGRYQVDARVADAIDAQMRGGEDVSGVYNTQGTLLARATQKVVLRNLRLRTIVQDLRARRSASGAQRYLTLTGPAEEGLVLEVRPDLEDQGRRVVRVRLRVARLTGFEPVVLSGVDQQGAKAQMPQYGPVYDLLTAAALADREAILLLQLLEEGSGRAIAVKVTTRKLQ